MTTSHTEGVSKGGEWLCPTPLSPKRSILHFILTQENLKESADLSLRALTENYLFSCTQELLKGSSAAQVGPISPNKTHLKCSYLNGV